MRDKHQGFTRKNEHNLERGSVVSLYQYLRVYIVQSFIAAYSTVLRGFVDMNMTRFLYLQGVDRKKGYQTIHWNEQILPPQTSLRSAFPSMFRLYVAYIKSLQLLIFSVCH